ncbi:N-acetylglucosamine-6-phosphate deacetylase [Acaricomes phytoseiuli]|uniref:N-acetylglucosamine-6-phosphate deacetylase n=1 Tax=Acaricomes phytoseiuli TaxID=291968 RepID=UPI002221348C|nr:N-acetylglucosamine-6-phosphate deacetylase [Acaricomes phytoseiuli]MCW1248732.1 N-acetylglucosamine-6-phosphate deacetylase [Acaricomes phytoseiuli]
MSTTAQRLLHGTLISDGARVDDGLVVLDGERISYAGPASDFSPAPDAERLPLPEQAKIIPGLVDVHNHGAAGADFPAAEEANARDAIAFLHRHGTTTLLASLVTASEAALLRGLELYADLSAEGLLAGIHLEGPFLSAARCGAQDPAFLRAPDLALAQRLIGAGQGQLTSMTYAPELPGAADLVELLTEHGVIPSLGHTDADDATAGASLMQAFDGLAGSGFDGHSARPTVTHLFNGMPPLHHRSPGPVTACLRAARSGRACVELIADGTHLDPHTVLTVFELVGAANILLVTDAMAATGLADGEYRLGPAEVTVREGMATLKSNGSIAGGTATLLQVVLRTVAAGVPWEAAVLSATAVPARMLGLSDELGSLRRGLRADVLVLSEAGRLVQTFRCGQLLESPAL